MQRFSRRQTLCATYGPFAYGVQREAVISAGTHKRHFGSSPGSRATQIICSRRPVPPGARNVFLTARRCCASAPAPPVQEEDTTNIQRTSVVHTMQSKEALVRAVTETQEALTALLDNFSVLLEDRRACYKDSYIEEQLVGPRAQLTAHFLELWSDVEAAKQFREKLQNGSEKGNVADSALHLNRHHVRSMKEDYVHGVEAAVENSTSETRVAILLKFYTALMASALVESEEQIRMLLDEMRTTDLVEPTAPIYQSLLCSLLLVSRDKKMSSAAKEKEAPENTDTEAAASSPSSSSPFKSKAKAGDIVVGEVKKLNRAEVGDLAGYYMGHALSHHRAGQSHYPAHLLVNYKGATSDASLTEAHLQAQEEGRAGMVEYVNADLWGTFLSICAMTHVAPKLVDLWWKKFVTFFDTERSIAKKRALFTSEQAKKEEGGDKSASDNLTESFLADLIASEMEAPTATPSTTITEVEDKSPLPYVAVHAMLSWAAAQRDIERVMRYFHETNKRGMWLPDGTFCPPGCLTLPLAELHKRYPAWVQQQQDQQHELTEELLQEMQLRMLSKLMAASKSVKMDGGLREVVSKDVRQLIPLSVLKGAPWGVLSDLMTGLSVSSTMQLLKLAASSRPNGDADVPFFVWASILRRCAHEHYLDHAESLFRFIRARFQLDKKEKRELIEIMMRMYSSLTPPDFSSTLAVFTDHVLRTPKDEAIVTPDAVLYTILIKAADSRETATMLFLEACGDGVELDADLFEAVLGANQHHVMSQLSRKLPHEYGTSDLDAQLRIPHNVDAHARREEALHLRGKTSFSSTGETGY